MLQLTLLLLTGVALARAFQLQVVQGELWQARSINQHEYRDPLPAPRGTIYDREGRELAVSRITYELYVAPRELPDPQAAAVALGRAVDLGPDKARLIAEGKNGWFRLPGYFSALEKDQLRERVPRGLHAQARVSRSYPRGELAAEIVGRVGDRGRGLSGLELSFDSVLAGQPGVGLSRKDATGASAAWLTVEVVPPTPGHDIYLTIDAELQALAESVLEDAVAESDATGGDLLILDPNTGELLAAASRRNRLRGREQHLTAATEPYEAGSTLKPFSVAALLAEDLAELSDSVDTGIGLYRVAGRTIRDDTPHGRLTLAQTLAVSSNVGMAKFAERIPKGVQFSYLRDFGFGTPTGLTYPSESAGLLRRPSEWSAQSRASLAIGYEVAVTPLQLVMAYGALANGGTLMRPQLVLEVRSPDGMIRWNREPEVIRRVISEQVASALRDVLAHAVAEGTGRSAGVRGLSVAGKTGTAWRFDEEMGYDGHSYISSFVGLIPSDDPQLVILVKLDEPSGPYYGGTTAAPVMRTAVRAALAGSYWSAPPLMGEPEIPDEQAGVPAGLVPTGGPYVFALDTPLLRTRDADVSSAFRVADRLPDVRGLSLRAAVNRLHRAGWRVAVRGGGRVVSMEPSVGTMLRFGEQVALTGTERSPPARPQSASGAG
ncbi:MAG: PASTA domain-containing protein [Gemmatimonadota bacterium]|nr:MAG: PASTA domain-containing protein [Gemmatimonadota bacterium]